MGTFDSRLENCLAMIDTESGPIELKKSRSAESDLAARQWAEWRTSRRDLIRMGAFAGGAIAAGGALTMASPMARSVAAQATPTPGGSIAMSLADDDVQNFDPIIPTDNMSIWTMLLIYDTLIRVGPDGNSLEPGLATSYTKSDDGLTFTFTLRPTNFHDGTPCTSADALYSMDRLFNSEDSQWAFIFPGADLAAPDDATVTVTLKSPGPC